MYLNIGVKMKRHPDNTNLTLHYGGDYRGLPIQRDKGPFIESYLDSLYMAISRAMEQYGRVFAFRVDIRLPADVYSSEIAESNEVIGRLIESFKAKIKHNRNKAFLANKYAHDTVVRYVWAREVGEGNGAPHYHLVILLNYDAFCALGQFEPGRDNMFNRLQEALASALSLSYDAVSGLIHFPDNARYRLDRGCGEELAAFFFRASYLCKAATKVYGDGTHGFGASRI
jgi:hypothetical protein